MRRSFVPRFRSFAFAAALLVVAPGGAAGVQAPRSAPPQVLASPSVPSGHATAGEVLRTTLGNGLRVVIVRNPFAPVVATSVNYLAGSNESPAGLPGTAHALEHMMFRGSPGLSAQQLSNIGSIMGGHYNANTREGLTQYYYTVPAEDLDVALHIEAARMRAIDSSEADWQKERGAINQEVSRDLSSPSFKVYQQVRARLYAGTPYEHTPLGSRETFAQTSADTLKKFHADWYAPNNAILVVVGDVEPKAALAKVRAIFGAIPARPLPARTAMNFKPVTPATFTVDSDQPYTLVYLALRLPGLKAPEYPALELLTDVMQSRRHALYDMVPQGKALATFFQYMPLPEAGIVLIGAAIPAGGDVKATEADLRAIIGKTVSGGVSPDLIAAAKRQEKRVAAQRANSIEGLASDWADAIALNELSAPDEDLRRLEAVTPSEVNRVAARYLKLDNAISVVMVPKPGAKPSVASESGSGENIALGETGPVTLPDWAKAAVNRVQNPRARLTPTVSTLANGLTLIVQPVQAGNSVGLYGFVRHNPSIQEPAGKEGVDMMARALMSYGTAKRDRIAFQSAADALGAEVRAGVDFSVRAMPKDFEKAVALMAENQFHPALPEDALEKLKPQYAQYAESNRQSPDYLAQRALDEALYPAGDPALREATGASIQALSRDDLTAYLGNVARPDMTAVVVIGAITPADARRVVEKYLGGWKAEGAKPDIDMPAIPDNRATARYVSNPTHVQADVTLAETLALKRTDADYYALQLGNAVLGGGVFTARLFNDLRVDNGLVYSVSSHLSAGRTRGDFSVSYGCDPDNAEKAAAIVVKDIRAMQDAPAAPEAFHTARAFLLRQLPLGEASVENVADGYLRRFNQGLPLDEPVRAASHLIALTPADVQSAFRKWLRPEDLVRITQGPARMAGK